jgi:hypothetical protein
MTIINSNAIELNKTSAILVSLYINCKLIIVSNIVKLLCYILSRHIKLK